jgi:tight adherence protein B
MNRFLVGLAAVALAAACAGSTLAASAPVRITEAGGANFPSRSYVLSLPRAMQLAPGAVSVSENGHDVDSLLVTSAGDTTSQRFGVVLAIDASTSMEGKPERAAFAAARAFALQRKGQEQLSVVTYNVTPTVTLPLTADQAKIDEALSKQPKFLFGTHIFDAVAHSLNVLRSAKVRAGTVVVLSDGQEHRGVGDTAHHESEETVAAGARAAHVRVFTVGLTSRLSNLETLKKLARDTGGRYIETTSINRLKAIYSQLGTSLANEYLIQYRSLAKAGINVEVRIKVKGLHGVATTAYSTPTLATLARAAKAPYKESVSHRIWTSTITAVVAGLLAAGLIGFGAYSLLSGPQRGTVRRRMAEFISVPGVRKGGRPTAQLTGKVLEGTESLLRGNSRWTKFKWELEVAQVKMPPEQIVVLTAVATLLTTLFVQLFWPLPIAIIIGITVPFAARSLIKRDLAKKRLQFAEQLPDNLQVLASALRAGHSFIGALAVVVNDAPEPARSEFQRVIADEQLGVPVDQALHVVVERMENRELEQVALVAAVQREGGGNTAEVLDRVTETIRERFELRRTIRTLTAQGRMSRWVLSLLPVSLFAIVSLVNPDYMKVLTETTGGKVLLVLAAISVVSGSLVIKKIVDIKV